ncbi:hypothetical protein [Oceanobacillus sp. CAU 1775]
MKTLNMKHLSWSLVFCIVLTLLIPSKFLSEGMGRYSYGFSFNYITIYQGEPNSAWFLYNFFNGNAGLLINLTYYAKGYVN